MINYLIFIALIFILGILIFILFNLKKDDINKKGSSENIQNKLNEVSEAVSYTHLTLPTIE